jgi:hypothetical protein
VNALISIKKNWPNTAFLRRGQQKRQAKLTSLKDRLALVPGIAVDDTKVEVMQMKKRLKSPAMPADDDAVNLAISPEKVCFIIIKAREFDAKEEINEPDPGSNPSDDKEAAVLEDREDDPVAEELVSLINSLSVDEQIDLVTLAWLGREDHSASDWAEVREEASRAHNERTASYLLGMPMLGDFLEEGLSMLGYSCEEFEIDRL